LESFYTEDFDKVSLSRAQTKHDLKFAKIDEDDKWSQTSESIDRQEAPQILIGQRYEPTNVEAIFKGVFGQSFKGYKQYLIKKFLKLEKESMSELTEAMGDIQRLILDAIE